jgi:hypothetical protein
MSKDITVKDLKDITYPEDKRGRRMDFTYKGEKLITIINGRGNLIKYALEELNKDNGYNYYTR